MSKLVERVQRGFRINVVGQLISIVVRFAFFPVAIAELGEDEFSVWLLAISYASMIGVFEFGFCNHFFNIMTDAFRRNDFNRFREAFHDCLAWCLLVCMLAIAYLLFIFFFIEFKEDVFFIISISHLVGIFFGVFSGIFRTIRKQDRLFLFGYLFAILPYLAIIFFSLVFDLDLLSTGLIYFLTQALIAFYFFLSALKLRSFRFLFIGLSFKSILGKRRVRYIPHNIIKAAPFGVIIAAQWMFANVPIFVLSHFGSSANVSDFAFCRMLANSLRGMLSSWSLSVWPEVSRMGLQESGLLFKRLEAKSLLILLLVFFVCVGVALIIDISTVLSFMKGSYVFLTFGEQILWLGYGLITLYASIPQMLLMATSRIEGYSWWLCVSSLILVVFCVSLSSVGFGPSLVVISGICFFEGIWAAGFGRFYVGRYLRLGPIQR